MRVFLMFFVVIFAVLTGLTVAGVAVAGHFFHSDISMWYDHSKWSSPCFLMLGLLMALSGITAGTFAVMAKAALRILSTPAKPRKKVRPRSNRPTLS